MNDKLNINLRIAGVAIPLSINRDEEQQLREVGKEVNHVFETYRKRFAGSSDKEVLAKVTLLFAKGYLGQVAATKELDEELDRFESELDSLLSSGIE